MKKLLEMFLSFFKIGAVTFGGGYAMIPLIEEEVVKNKKWITKEEFLDILVISQSFPGALAVNCSTFIGYKIGGMLGGIIGILGVILPSFFIILIIAMFLMGFRDNYYVNLAFKGINAAVPMMVLVAIVSLAKSIKINWINCIIILIIVITVAFFRIHPVLVIILSAGYGIIFFRKGPK